MEQVTTKLYGASWDSYFPSAVPFSEKRIGELSSTLAALLAPVGVQPQNFSLTKQDELFSYELSVVIFNGNGRLTFNAQEVSMAVDNAKSQQDFHIIADTTMKVVKAFGELPGNTHHISAYTHAAPVAAGALERYLSQFETVNPALKKAGLLAYLKPISSAEEIRISIEPSVKIQGGFYINWQIPVEKGKAMTPGLLDEVNKAINETAHLAGIAFSPLK